LTIQKNNLTLVNIPPSQKDMEKMVRKEKVMNFYHLEKLILQLVCLPLKMASKAEYLLSGRFT